MASWITAASADHARIGLAQGFIQVNHGKSAPLRRFAAGDRVAIYAPVQVFGGRDRLQAFVALGRVTAGEPYRVDMEGGFTPYRRDVAWTAAETTPIAPLLERLSFTAGKRNWGAPFRWGLFRVEDADMAVIADAMGWRPGAD